MSYQFDPTTNVARGATSGCAPTSNAAAMPTVPPIVAQRLSIERRLEQLRSQAEPMMERRVKGSQSVLANTEYIAAKKPDQEMLDKNTDASVQDSSLVMVKKQALALREQTTTMIKHPRFQTIALGGGSGLVIMGPTCAFLGGGAGITIGTMVGFVPALFTFGLSIPAGAAIGGAAGTCLGLAFGGGSGLILGGTAGHVGHAYRVEIKNGFVYIKTKTGERKIGLQVFISKLADNTRSRALEITHLAHTKVSDAQQKTKSQVLKIGKQAQGVVGHPRFQVTAASAASGAAVGGAGGGAAGLVTGGAIGAAVGVIPALFTFGLSIPVGAAIGGGAGLCFGTAAGSTAGAVGGGATGYQVHSYRNEIKAGASSTWTTVGSYAGVLKSQLTRFVG